MTGNPEDLTELSGRILRLGGRGPGRIDFLREVSKMVLDFSKCDALDLRLTDPDLDYRWEVTRKPKRSFRFVPSPHDEDTRRIAIPDSPYRSQAVIRFQVDKRTRGILRLRSLRANHFAPGRIKPYQAVARSLGLAIANRRAQWALRERVKELTCLYGIARVVQEPGFSLPETLRAIAALLAPAWQYPEIACARIVLDGRSYTTSGFQEGPHSQVAEIRVSGAVRGAVELFYTRDKIEFAAGPFLKEERSLIDTIAREVALIVERRDAEEYKLSLQDQLRHADRLATIGQLAAGVAHELNEPLGSILGFAQLARKDPQLPERSAGDIDKIVKASLHAREVIHKLLVFARQMPPLKTPVNLNRIVDEGLYFLESRCAKAGIEVVRSLALRLPEISADASQLQQVLINLVVNAIQAMPDGGKLTIQTVAGRDSVSLIVEDMGTGMSDDVQKKLFSPFFTTKDVNEGTGLGLAVVHGIVTSHGGSIRVKSAPGRGARFEIQLPTNSPAAAEG